MNELLILICTCAICTAIYEVGGYKKTALGFTVLAGLGVIIMRVMFHLK